MAISSIQNPITASSLIEQNNASKVNSGATTGASSGAGSAAKSSSLSFDQLLNEVNTSQNESDTMIQKLAAGEDVDLHQVLIASEQADISLRVALAIRDKLVESYREVMRMSV